MDANDPYEAYYGPEDDDTTPDGGEDAAYEAYYGPEEDAPAAAPVKKPRALRKGLRLPMPALGRKALIDLIKALLRVKQHQMTTRSGKVVTVREHTRTVDTRAIAKNLAQRLRAKAGVYVHGTGEVDPDAESTHERFSRKVKVTRPDGSKAVERHYTPERVKLHEALVKKVAGNIPSAHQPVAILTAGGPASGKSGLLPIIREEFGDDLAHIDSDQFKEGLPEYHHKLEHDPENAAKHAHAESSHLCEKTIGHCMKHRKSFVYDSTFSHPESTKAMIDALKAAGYRVHIRYADLPVEEAQKREEARFREEKRRVPADVLARLHRGAIATFGQLAHAGDSVQVFNTNVERNVRPTKVYEHSAARHFEDDAHLKDMAQRGHEFMRNLPGRG